MLIRDFTKPEAETCIKLCNFTLEEKKFFELRLSDCTIEQCAEKMSISLSTAKRFNKRVKNKIERIKN